MNDFSEDVLQKGRKKIGKKLEGLTEKEELIANPKEYRYYNIDIRSG